MVVKSVRMRHIHASISEQRVAARVASFFFFPFLQSNHLHKRRMTSACVALRWPYKDGNITREQGARPRLLWQIGECERRGGACGLTERGGACCCSTPDGRSEGPLLLSGGSARRLAPRRAFVGLKQQA